MIREVRKYLMTINQIGEQAAYGKQPIIDFKFPKELTKDVVKVLYKLILSSHMHMHYKAVQEYLKVNHVIIPSQIQVLTNDLAGIKKNCWYLLIINLVIPYLSDSRSPKVNTKTTG